MTAQQVKKMLPIIFAFAHGIPIQYRNLKPGKNYSGEWLTLNPDTTEFRLTDDFSDPAEWRIKPQKRNCRHEF